MARERLSAAGDRIRRARQLIADETEDIATLLDAYLLSGITPTEAAELLGMSRQSVYDLRQRGIRRTPGLEQRILSYLAAGGATPVAGLVERTHVTEGVVARTIETLVEAKLVARVAMQHEAGVEEPWYCATDAGLAALEEWIWRTNERPQMWTAYVPMLPEERPALESVAIDVFGLEWFAVLEPGTVRDQNLAELAFNVTAPSFDGAREQAAIRARELYAAAGIDGAWAIRTILPADVWHAVFGGGA
jgi:hypothetical protein